MQVSTMSSVPASIGTMFQSPKASATRPADGTSKVESERQAGLTRGVDFSSITPRQLLAYLDERIASDTIDPDEAVGLVGMLGSMQYSDAPDVPFDLRARVNGCRQYSEQNGSPLAAWYAHLGKQLDIMEAQSVHLSVVA
jgi:hypothetical protein